MRHRSPRLCLLGLALLFLGACSRTGAPPSAQPSPLFTGHEAKRRILLTFPASQKAGFVNVTREIYGTASMVAQAKQILMALMAGPSPAETQALPCFGPQSAYLEVYLDGKGLAVVDLPSSTVDALPGGTSSEVATLYCLVHTLVSDVPQVSRVQVLIDGQSAESLRGHFDIQDPLSVSDF